MMDDRELEAAITRALEQRREPLVPEGFAARVRASLPAQSARRRTMPAGRTAAIAAVAVLTVGLFAVARYVPAASMTSVAFDMEMVMLAELAAVAYWLALAGPVRGRR